jgi:hypothetical protein
MTRLPKLGKHKKKRLLPLKRLSPRIEAAYQLGQYPEEEEFFYDNRHKRAFFLASFGVLMQSLFAWLQSLSPAPET